MKNQITQVSESEFTLQAGAHNMTLQKETGARPGWAVYTTNASTRAWNGGIGSYRHFDTLEQVELRYKSWRGILALVGMTSSVAA